MRVKNEARWIVRSIRSIHGLCDRIFVLDDHSSDDTADLAEQAGADVLVHPWGVIDEARDKTFLLQTILGATGASRRVPASPPLWILMIDGDEELVEGHDVLIRKALLDQPHAVSFAMRVAFLWNSPEQERVDGVYANMTRPSLFNASASNCVFRAAGSGPNFHCGSVPRDLYARGIVIPAVLKHYGYLHKADRIRKYNWYNAIDPNNEAEDHYRHMVIGDLFPEDTVAKHGGPLRVIPCKH